MRWDLPFKDDERQALLQRISAASPTSLAGRRVEGVDTRDGHRFLLEKGYWTLIRFSGTEPLLRIYAEGESATEVNALLAETRALAGL